jgi:glutamate:Na+ symporter, ESS family
LAGPQLALGVTIASGQYVVGLLLAVLVLVPLFGLDPMVGAPIEVGFEGGHGTAAGLGDTFEGLGFPEGQDLALGLATVGVVSGVVIGIALVNWSGPGEHRSSPATRGAPWPSSGASTTRSGGRPVRC